MAASYVYPHTRCVNMRQYGPMESEKLNTFSRDVRNDLAVIENLTKAIQAHLEQIGQQLTKGGVWTDAGPLP